MAIGALVHLATTSGGAILGRASDLGINYRDNQSAAQLRAMIRTAEKRIERESLMRKGKT